MTIQDLKDKNLLIFEAIVGSHSHGTAEETSDIDKAGVFVLPLDMYLTGDIIEKVSDEGNNNNYYEIGNFINLLVSGKPNVIELLYSPEDMITYEHDLFRILKDNKEMFITKKLKDSFGKYANSQMGKARGLNKKIVNKMNREKKTPIDFCFVIDGYKTYPLQKFLDSKNYKQKFCGLVKVPNAENIFALFYDEFSHVCFDETIPLEERNNSKEMFKTSFKGYKGIVKETEDGTLISNEIRLSSIPMGEQPKCVFSYNMNGYSKYCKDYKEYFEWEEKRNKARYDNTIKHGKGYDAKNMQHCSRLLSMCIEIGEGKGVIIRRPDREHLLSIKHGESNYDDLIKDAKEKLEYIEKIYPISKLPEDCDINIAKNFLIKIRKGFYNI